MEGTLKQLQLRFGFYWKLQKDSKTKIEKGKGQKLQERGQKSEGKEVQQIEVKLILTTLKPIHAKWLVDFYDHMTTPKEK